MPAASTSLKWHAHWPHRYFDLAAVLMLLVAVATVYGARLARQPVVGEETRYATGAREMLATGDWVVARQQGQIFAERPPMTMWLIAAVGWVRGEVDPIAIRLPSVIAVMLTSLLIYAYSRQLLTRTVGVAAAIIYATMGQVLQIGRLGESEAIFALFVSASLLLWHLGYTRGWRPLLVWSLSGAFAALAALTKGPQAPAYFGAITGAYLLLRRDWRYLFSWSTAVGIAVFVAIMAAWQIPYYQATNWSAVVATWTGLAGDRFQLRGALSHAVTYPLETLGCLLPWSPMLAALLHRKTRELLTSDRQVVSFLVTAILVAYPTVWLAAGARGRYFMPLYPLAAILISLVVVRCSHAELGTYPRRAWHQFLLIWGLAISAIAAAMIGSAVSPALAQRLFQSPAFGLAFAGVASTAVYAIWTAFRRGTRFAPLLAVFAIAAVAAIGSGGAMINVNTARWNDPTAAVAELRQLLPDGAKLVSLSPIDHRFVYFYNEDIAELKWPRTLRDLPPDVDYFCFMRDPNDTAESRASGRGRTWTTTPGTLPFAWEEVTTLCAERQPRGKTPIVVIGRVIRPLVATTSDVTKPQQSVARLPTSTQFK